MKIKVSAVVPAFNAVNTLERAISSLLIQPEIDEIFVVDDGSTDGSFELAKNLEFKYSLIKVLIHEGRINKGASASRNLGLKHCKNEWIQFLDADDELLEGKILNQIICIRKDSPLILGRSLWKNSKRIRKEYFKENLHLALISGYIGNTCSNLWNKNWIEKSGGWDETLINTQEHELVFRIFKINSKFSFSYGFLTLIYENPNSTTRSSDKKSLMLFNQYKLRLKILNYLKKTARVSFLLDVEFAGYIGTLNRNNKDLIEIPFSKIHYFFFKVRKSFYDRFLLFKN
ncbi:glycosyltransferase family 2 protein [Algoriphagus namhaensis]